MGNTVSLATTKNTPIQKKQHKQSPNTKKEVEQTKTTTKPSSLKEPAKHTAVVTVTEGESLGSLAAEYHTTVSEIAKLNGLQPNSNLKIGQKLKLNTYNKKEYAEYKKALAKKEDIQMAKEEAEFKKHQAESLKNNIATAQSRVGKAYKLGLGEGYGFAVDKKTGNVTIKTKKGTTFAEIKNSFGIKDGVIGQNNDMSKFEKKEIGDRGIESYDNVTLAKGTQIVVPANSFNPQEEKSLWQKFKDLF